jgi:hypothetical protein
LCQDAGGVISIGHREEKEPAMPDLHLDLPKDFRIDDVDISKLDLRGPSRQLFGHVVLIQAYDIRAGMPGTVPDYRGTRALVVLRDEPGKTVAVVSTDDKLRGALELALATGNMMYVSGRQDVTPYMPLGGTTTVDVYEIYEVTVYGTP